MAAIPSPLPLRERDVHQVIPYLGDENHKNHKYYKLHTIEVAGTESAQTFSPTLSAAMNIINCDRKGKETVNVWAQWYVLSFPKGSHLSPFEMRDYESIVINPLGAQNFHLKSWHSHKFNGEADLNILAPEIKLEPIPMLDRPREFNRLGRTRNRSDEWIVKANENRANLNLPLIPTINEFDPKTTTGLAKLLRWIGPQFALQNSTVIQTQKEATKTVSSDTLFAALDGAGVVWQRHSISQLLEIHKWPDEKQKKKGRSFKIHEQKLLKSTAQFLHFLHRQNERQNVLNPTQKGIEGNTMSKNRADGITISN